MRRKIKIDFDGTLAKLHHMNELEKYPNDFFEIQKRDDGNISLSILKTGEEISVMPNIFGKLFNFRNSFKCQIDFDKQELEVFTTTPIHTHTEYSILDGANRIKDLAGKYNYSGAITDHGVMYGVIDFYKKMTERHKKPILGFEAYTKSRTGEDKRNHLILLAKNDIGFKNLMKICSNGNLNPSNGRAVISYEDLSTYHDGLIVLSACVAGEIPRLIMDEKEEELQNVFDFYQTTFGDDFYLEIQRHASKETILAAIDEANLKVTVEKVIDDFNKMTVSRYTEVYGKHVYRNVDLYLKEIKINPRLIELSKKHGIKLVATTDAHFLNSEDSYMHEALLCNQTKKTITNPDRFRFAGTGYHVHTVDEMEQLFYDLPEALVNSLDIEEKCNVTIEFGNYKLPNFPIPDGYTDKTYLEALVWNGFEERYGKNVEEFKTRLTPDEIIDAEELYEKRKERVRFELDTVFKMGYQGYFFIVWDYVKYAKEHGIAVGPGRGCVTADTLLYTESGLKKICNIKVGDKVFTHDGTLKTVLATHKYPTEVGERLIKPRVYYGDEFGNAYTENHKILAVKEKGMNPEWIAAKDLQVGDMVVTPKLKTEMSEETKNKMLEKFENENIPKNNYIGNEFRSNSWKEVSDIKTLLTSMNLANGLGFNMDCGFTITVADENSDWRIEKNEEYALKKIYDIETKTSDYVYDITVEENHSYVTTNFVAHNSGAGSIILYCLHITEKLDPLKYDLLFERFLNPDRISMPDIDLGATRFYVKSID